MVVFVDIRKIEVQVLKNKTNLNPKNIFIQENPAFLLSYWWSSAAQSFCTVVFTEDQTVAVRGRSGREVCNLLGF